MKPNYLQALAHLLKGRRRGVLSLVGLALEQSR